MNQRLQRLIALTSLAVAPAACFQGGGKTSLPTTGVTAETHSWFPITAGNAHALGRVMSDGTMSCDSCHAPTNTTFKDFSCVGCHGHEQAVTDRLHLARPDQYQYASASCYSCHTNGNAVGFSHFGIAGNCAQCHDAGSQFAALPLPGFTHPATNGADCASCHDTSSWKGAAGSAPRDSHDPARDVAVDALIPTYGGPWISTLSPDTQLLPQVMNHGSPALDAGILATCANCHLDAGSGIYYPGQLHASLAVLKAPQPAACGDCHAATMPTGFVGPLDGNRTPASGAMKHDAVAWTGGAPGATPLVTADCGVCHQTPTQSLAGWAVGVGGINPVGFHAPLTAAAQPPPSSCIDCHANSRPCPSGNCSAPLTAAAFPSLPASVQFDHQSPEALADCSGCHTSAAATQGTSWAGGKFHLPGAATPKSCLPCHAGERPTSTAGWASATFTQSPFDYGTNGAGVTHGDGLDCASCHNGPGTGAWGGTPNWIGGRFAHGAASDAGTTCIACHLTQRPTAPVMSFDHATNGQGDCFGCHQAALTAGKFVNYNNPATGTLPGGDWQGGQSYPGSALASGGDQSIKVTAIRLTRSGANNLVTGTTSSVETLYNGIVHTSPAIDSRISPGTAASPDNTKCWHCHTNTAGTVTAYAGGKFHAALTAFAATPGGAVTPIAQPTSRCGGCHAQMLPTGIVESAASDLQPMDHGIDFAAAVTIGGASVTTVAQIDCSVCHKSPGATWADGRFHANIGAGVPKDCTACHYPLLADAARADLTSGAAYAMRHRSGQITFQACERCHAGALSKSTLTPIAAAAWSPGAYHPSLTGQPTACVDCHAVSDPAPNVPTQSSVKYTLALGGTASNAGQWMNHGSSLVAGKDCAACHAADAKTSGSAWSKSTAFHATTAGKVTTCNGCHGVSNGGGATAGTNNNLPVGLTSSTTVTSAAKDTTTGIAAGTLDQISHADVNVTGHDCAFCHTQVGPSTAAGVQGKEWAQAKLHANFNAANPLVANGTTGRCSGCHLNVKPGASFTAQSHAAYTNASGSTDCASCHSWPGAGGAAAPNWLGASGGVPTVISVGGFTIAKPPAANTTTAQKGITNLPHPTVGSQACTACHTSAAGGRQAIGYDHASTLNNANCNACHEAGSDLVSPVWNGSTSQSGGAGDTRPFTIGSLKATKGGSSCTVTYANHFFPADCSQCHPKPAGTVVGKTGSAFTSIWNFNHNENNMKGLCNMCHGPCPS
jgi:cytochrome c551/c552